MNNLGLLLSCLLVPGLLTPSTAWGDSTLPRAIDLHRRGNCKDALPLLDSLAAREPHNRSIAKLRASCLSRTARSDPASTGSDPKSSPSPAGLREARAQALRPAQDPTAAQPSRKRKTVRSQTQEPETATGLSAPAGSGRYAVRVATTVLRGQDPKAVLRPIPPQVAAARRHAAEPPEPAPERAARRSARATRKKAPPTAKSLKAESSATTPPPPPVSVAAEAREREAAGPRLLAAERLIKAKKPAEALPLLESLVNEKPELLLPRLRLAEVLSGQKLFVEAASHYGELAGRQHGAGYRLRQAQNLSWAGRLPESAAAFRQYLEQAPDDAGARLGLAQVLFWSDRLPEAAEAYSRYLDLAPEDAEARLNLGRALLWTGKFDGAFEQFSLARRKLGPNPELDLLVARSLEQSTRPERALLAYDELLSRDPGNKDAAEGRERVAGLVLLKRGYALQEKNDYQGALEAFTAYLEKNPGDEPLLLQVARLYSWKEDRKRALESYESYLKRQPRDEAALRELARVQISIPDFAGARKTYASLVTLGNPSIEDYEGLVNAHIWDGQFQAAQPFVRKLLELDPDNAVGRKAYAAWSDKRREQDLDAAQRLAAAGKYKEAIEAYRVFVAEHGASWDIELAVARLYGWNRQTPQAIQAYQEYLQRYPTDHTARLELADLQRWAGRSDAASHEYTRVLQAQPQSRQALFGLAQIADSRGDDRFAVYNAYRHLLLLEPGHQQARERLNELMPAISPSIRFRMNNFHDSDDFGRQITTVEIGVPFRGGLKLSPLVRHGYFNQYRQVTGSFCDAAPAAGREIRPEVQQISDSVCAARGQAQALGGGARFEFAPNTSFSFSGEAVALRMNTPGQRTAMNAFLELVVRPRPSASLLFRVQRTDAVYDVNTVGSLFAGIVQDGFLVSYEQPLSQRWRLWLSGGLARFNGGAARAFDPSVQRRFSARADYYVLPWMRTGYFVRASGFTRYSPVYFSPEFYGTTGLHYGWDKPLLHGLRSIGELEAGYGRINRYDMAGVNVAEFSLHAGIAWDIRPDLTLRLGYRFGRGRSSTFGSPVYSTGILDFGMSNYWIPAMPAVNPNRIEIR